MIYDHMDETTTAMKNFSSEHTQSQEYTYSYIIFFLATLFHKIFLFNDRNSILYLRIRKLINRALYKLINRASSRFRSSINFFVNYRRTENYVIEWRWK